MSHSSSADPGANLSQMDQNSPYLSGNENIRPSGANLSEMDQNSPYLSGNENIWPSGKYEIFLTLQWTEGMRNNGNEELR
ncbi:hypothetical protein BDA96_09G102300 [Sorghum bicolor]|uniref:Uncharacterized protein n=1 Tax=Sorghum bicolor TaxID=4558 RepID=A0A921U452_SORBI|nr:hypothetical protein BDA96_09G102300 [Sorghum bicolor]